MAEEEGTELNSISDIRRYFTEGQRPLDQGEFIEFWKSLSDDDKMAFQLADLSNG